MILWLLLIVLILILLAIARANQLLLEVNIYVRRLHEQICALREDTYQHRSGSSG